MSWGSPSSDLCVTYPNLASPTGNIFARGLLIVQNCFVFVVFSSKIKVSIILKIIQWNYQLMEQNWLACRLGTVLPFNSFRGFRETGPRPWKPYPVNNTARLGLVNFQKSSRVLCKVRRNALLDLLKFSSSSIRNFFKSAFLLMNVMHFFGTKCLREFWERPGHIKEGESSRRPNRDIVTQTNDNQSDADRTLIEHLAHVLPMVD